jgi:hypothetical protein
MSKVFDRENQRLWESLQDAQAAAREMRALGAGTLDQNSSQSLSNIIDLCEISKVMRDQVMRQVQNGVTKTFTTLDGAEW